MVKMGYSFTEGEFDNLLKELNQDYNIFAPTILKGEGRFSDTDQVRYGQINSFSELEYEEKSAYSAKEIVFPITQTLFYFIDEKIQEPEDEQEDIIIFLRPCDLNALDRLDKIFLENGEEKDIYYERVRQKIKFFVMECTEGFENCFCVSMGTNKVENYDAFFRFAEGKISCELQNDNLKSKFNKSADKCEFIPKFITENKTEVTLPDPDKINNELFEHKVWKEYSQRCIACGRCNMVCPSCSCFTTQDIVYEDNENCGERRRVWAGCHIDGYTEMAGGHGFRAEYGDRMRFKTMHKIYDFKQRFGIDMCVGCGRCDDICPEYISFAKCINKLNQIIEEEETDVS